jgi:hypothetical protein
MTADFDRATLRSRAERFSIGRFDVALREAVTETMMHTGDAQAL